MDASDAGSDGEKSRQERKQEKSESGSKNAKKSSGFVEGKASAKESVEVGLFEAEKFKGVSAREQPGSATSKAMLREAGAVDSEVIDETNISTADSVQQARYSSVLPAKKNNNN